MRWFAMLAVAVACALGTPILSVPTATGTPVEEPSEPDLPGLGIKLREIPQALEDDPRARMYIIDNVAPGTVIERDIEVANRTGRDQPVEIYPGAAHIEDESGFAVEDGAAVNDLTTWMKPGIRRLDMASGDVATVTLTIDVPRDAPEGEQYAVLWAQVSSAGPPGSGTVVVNRVGIRVYLSVGPGNGPKPDFTIDSLTPRRNDTGSHEIVALVHNTGGRALDLAGNVTLSGGPGGLSLGPKPAAGFAVAPDRTAEIVFPLDVALAPGPWQVTATLTSGTLTRSASASLTFPDSGTGESVDTSPPSATGTPLTWYFVGAGFAVLIGLVTFLAYRLLVRPSEQAGDRR